MKIFVARHGRTEWNDLRKLCGLTDVELNATGKMQAEELAAQAKKLDLDLVITSPLKRAYETGRAAAEACGAPILTDVRLIEQDFGVFEGENFEDPTFRELEGYFAHKFPKGESMMQVVARVFPFLNELKEKYEGKRILLVSHGFVCRIIRGYFCDMTNDEFLAYSAKNGVIEEYDL